MMTPPQSSPPLARFDPTKLAGARALVVGLGASGLAAARLLGEKGATVLANDHRALADWPPALVAAVDALGVEKVAGGHPEELFTSVDLIVLSPGVPSLAALESADAAGVPVVAEVELASWFIDGTLVGITGTNGKSTVTSLVGAMAEASGRPTFLGGNLGTPLAEVVGTPAAGASGVVVVELSSFQLERVDTFRPKIAALLNLSPDHLDRYPGYAEYVAAKARLFHAQGRDDHAVVSAGDEVSAGLARIGDVTLHRFGGVETPTVGSVRRDGGELVDDVSGLRVSLGELALGGAANAANARAAMLIARLLGIDSASIRRVLTTFSGLPHRMARVAEIDGVTFYDDSKATNVGAAVAAVAGFAEGPGKVVLIAGGKDKGGSYAPLQAAGEGIVRALVTLGHAAPRIEAALDFPGERAASLADAVRRAHALAEPGDAVLLAPACSSFDMFRSFAERGERFVAAVRRLAEEAG